MADESTANAISGESSTPTTDVGTAGAGGNDDVSTQSIATQAADSTPDAGENFSDVWSLEDEAQETVADEELTDEQIAQYLQDQNLNQEHAPKLVEDLRGSRAQAKALRNENVQLKQQLAALDQLGGIEGINRMASVGLGQLMADPAQGALPFLQSVFTQSQPAYTQMVDTMVANDTDYVLSRLEAAGKLPQTVVRADAVDQEILGTIPEQLRDIYKGVPPEVRDEYDLMTPAAREYALQQQFKINQLEGHAKARAKADWDGQVAQAKQAGESLVQNLSDQFEKAHYAQLNKWQPLGPDNAEANNLLYSVVLEGAFAQLMKEESYSKMFTDCLGYLNNAPMRRLHNEAYAADSDEREGRALATRFNTRLGQVMKDLIKNPVYGLDTVFRDARQWREHQRQQAPDRKEIPGTGAQIPANNGGKKGSALDENGRLSDGFMRGIKQRLSGFGG